MRRAIQKLAFLSVLLALMGGYAFATTPHKASGKAAKHGHRHGKRKASWKKKGQQGIKSDRTMEIQQALIREKYLNGEPNGEWDARTQAALVKFQADNGWQTKVVPDSRALIKLGLGPHYSAENLVNPLPAGATRTAASQGINGGTDK